MKHLISFILAILVLTGTMVADPALLERAAPDKPATTSSAPASVGSSAARKKTPASPGGAKVLPGPKLEGPGALATLNTLKVKGKAPATGYNRNGKFGNGWKDFNGNKCDERQDTLKRDMSKVKYKDAKQCQLASGVLDDSYTGTTIKWKVNSGSVDIDHMVALKNVWISGGQQLSQDQRLAVANDPLNLMASQASANRSKGDANAAEWLPSYKSFRCRYVAIQISVKKKYALAVTRPESEAMRRVLNTCPKQKAAKVTPIKLVATKAPRVAPKGHAAPTKKPSVNATKPKAVSPGAYCAKADKGSQGIGKKNGKSYTCKTSSTDTRLRWR
ncbi:HNH endonuclease family protein [Paeniglutamicibacter antarcticus]|uniref:HNH endonuclease family protein n=1 Tax=Paeniglutamicibacter antarcticus TaxID=494023 RepID=A0ABP9THM0_9MICC